jgi:DNA repair protein RecO (recombination protein O)
MAIQKSDAIVLKTRSFRETSLIVNFFTKDFGKISGLIKGIRNEPQRYGGLPLVFSATQIVFYEKPGSGLTLVTQCDLENAFSVIRKDLQKSHYAHYFIELLDAVTFDYDKNEALYQLLANTLSALCQDRRPEQIARIFEVRLLNLSGFKPRLDACVNCQSEILSQGRFSAALGGILCRQCSFRDEHAQEALKGTLASIAYLERTDWPKALQLKMNNKIAGELSDILEKFLNMHLDKKISSRKFLN